MSELTPSEQSDSENMRRLKAWATPRALSVVASAGTQREPENVVAIKEGEGFGVTLLSRSSRDSIDTAAMYLINVIDRLRLED